MRFPEKTTTTCKQCRVMTTTERCQWDTLSLLHLHLTIEKTNIPLGHVELFDNLYFSPNCLNVLQVSRWNAPLIRRVPVIEIGGMIRFIFLHYELIFIISSKIIFSYDNTFRYSTCWNHTLSLNIIIINSSNDLTDS